MFIVSFYTRRSIQNGPNLSPLATWAPEFESFGNSDTWPEIWRPKIIPDPTRYVVKNNRRQHLRIQNEMDEENTHQTYICGQCKQPGHSRDTCTESPNNEGNIILIFLSN
jgi:hypothetical protein